jgi:hypothetical protein
MGGPEYARYVGIKGLEPVGVFLPGTQVYPGGVPFDPLQYSSKPDEFLEQQVWQTSNFLRWRVRLNCCLACASTSQATVSRAEESPCFR